MTKIYVVYANFLDDGCGKPEGAYSTRELAEAAVAARHFNDDFGSDEIVELTLDAPIAGDA